MLCQLVPSQRPRRLTVTDPAEVNRPPGELAPAVERSPISASVTRLVSITEAEPPASSGFKLKTIQFSAEITAKGEFKLLGTGGGMEAKSAVVFTLEKG